MTKKIYLIFLIFITFCSCDKEQNVDNSMLPRITTLGASNISSSSATIGGKIVSNGNENITSFGICWASTPEPTINSLHLTYTSYQETFFTTIQDLTKNQTYYVRSYATNSVGTSYGNQITFTTDAVEQIYISGISDGRCVYWKDGILNELTNSGLSNFALGNAITVTNGDIYVAGYELSANNYLEAKIWKNGTATTLASLQSTAKAVAVVNNDVYVVGTENTIGSSYVVKLWKNGVGTILTTPGANGNSNSIFVVNNDVYVGGIEESGVDRKGIIWKNGIPTRLYGFCFPNANATCTYDYTNINDIYVKNSDVYAIGTSISSSGIDDNIMWKNGVAMPINIKPASIFVKNNDIYIVGTVGNTAALWKNGTITSLTNGNNQAYATSVYVLGNDVYVAGLERISGSQNTIAKFWKNGVVFNLSTGTVSAEATDIFVL